MGADRIPTGRGCLPSESSCSWLDGGQNAVPSLPGLWLRENLALLKQGCRPPFQAPEFLAILYTQAAGSEDVERQGHPFFCLGIEAALYQLSTTVHSPSSLLTNGNR